jgi:catechol 2,3-dioxygenase-like lactoylglutathione lyase family enzyme
VNTMSVMPNLYSADVERSAAFYRDLLGGTQTFRTPAAGVAEHVELRLGDVTIALSSRDAVARQGLPAPEAGHPMELVVWCDSADDAVAALRAAGTPVLVEPYSHAAGHRRAYVADPDGNWIALVSEEAA